MDDSFTSFGHQESPSKGGNPLPDGRFVAVVPQSLSSAMCGDEKIRGRQGRGGEPLSRSKLSSPLGNPPQCNALHLTRPPVIKKASNPALWSGRGVPPVTLLSVVGPLIDWTRPVLVTCWARAAGSEQFYISFLSAHLLSISIQRRRAVLK